MEGHTRIHKTIQCHMHGKKSALLESVKKLTTSSMLWVTYKIHHRCFLSWECQCTCPSCLLVNISYKCTLCIWRSLPVTGGPNSFLVTSRSQANHISYIIILLEAFRGQHFSIDGTSYWHVSSQPYTALKCHRKSGEVRHYSVAGTSYWWTWLVSGHVSSHTRRTWTPLSFWFPHSSLS